MEGLNNIQSRNINFVDTNIRFRNVFYKLCRSRQTVFNLDQAKQFLISHHKFLSMYKIPCATFLLTHY